jgi:hypothetical protein
MNMRSDTIGIQLRDGMSKPLMHYYQVPVRDLPLFWDIMRHMYTSQNSEGLNQTAVEA